jgi:hypothetical protein
MKSLLNAFTKKEGKEEATGSVGHNERLLTASGGRGESGPPKIAGC